MQIFKKALQNLLQFFRVFSEAPFYTVLYLGVKNGIYYIGCTTMDFDITTAPIEQTERVLKSLCGRGRLLDKVTILKVSHNSHKVSAEFSGNVRWFNVKEYLNRMGLK